MKDQRVRDLMTSDVHHVSPRLHVLDLDRELAAHRISGAPVLDRSGRVLGIVSRSDIDRAMARERSRAAAVASYYVEVDPSDEEAIHDARDPTSAALESVRGMTVQDIMTKEVISVSPDARLAEAAKLMHSRRIHRVLVTENDALVGLLSSLDIVGAVGASA